MIELTLRIVFSLLVVLGLMWALAKAVRRPLAGRRGGLLEVVARQQLSRGSSVVILKVGERGLVLGVTDQQVSVLGETDVEAEEEPGQLREAVPLSELAALAAAADRQPARPYQPAAVPPAPASGPLAGSLLSPATWRQALSFLRNRGRTR